MRKSDVGLLKRILVFLNQVPNRKYGDNYQLASELTKLITSLEEITIEIKETFETLKEDAEMALADNWDRSDDGFLNQIEIIDEILNKLNI